MVQNLPPNGKVLSEGINKHVKYEIPSFNSSKVMAKVKVFKKSVKGQGQGHKTQNFIKLWFYWLIVIVCKA